MQTENSAINPYGKIYRLTNKINGKMYHGQTTMLVEKRWDKYKLLQCKDQPKIYNALKKYGPKNFLFEVVDTTAQNQEQLDSLEIDYIVKFDSMNNGYNCDPGGKGGGKKSEETKRKMSISQKGRIGINLGKSFSKSHKENISKALKGITRSNEYKLKMSERFKGKIATSETKRKISDGLKRYHALNHQITN